MCAGSWNTFDDLSSRVRVSNETEYLNLYVFHMIVGMNESISLPQTYANVNVRLMVKNVTWIKIGMTINVSVSAKI